MRAAACSSFNGATLLRAWRAGSFGRNRIGRGGRASTEPRSFERGERAACLQASLRRRGFNGATLLRAWRARSPLRPLAPLLRLQRSHAPSSVESPPAPAAPAPSHGLQRSHAPSSVERSSCVVVFFPAVLASTEPRSFERGESGGFRGSGLHTLASTEPRSFERGETGAAPRTAARSRSFNGATLLRAWRGLSPLGVRMGPEASTEPRSFERGEQTPAESGMSG